MMAADILITSGSSLAFVVAIFKGQLPLVTVKKSAPPPFAKQGMNKLKLLQQQQQPAAAATTDDDDEFEFEQLKE